MANASLGYRMPAFCYPWEFFKNFYCCIIFVAKERTPEVFVEFNLILCDILESLYIYVRTIFKRSSRISH